MSGPDERLPRLLALLPWLRANPGVRVSTVAEQFGITENQVRADVELLWFCGLPGLGPSDLIDVEFEGDTIRVVDAQTLDRPLRLTGDEGQALLAAARALREVPGLVDAGALDSVIDKLRGAVASGRVEDPVVAVELASVGTGQRVMETIREALDAHRRLRLRYLVERRDELTERVVDPVELRLVDGFAYLLAWDSGRRATRSFRLDRMIEVEALAEQAAVPEAARADVGEQAGPGFTPSDADTAVVIDLGARVRWVADQYPVESADERPDGGLRISLRTPDTDWLVRLVLRMGGDAVVVAPDRVAAAVRATATAGLGAYDGSVDAAGGASGHTPQGVRPLGVKGGRTAAEG